MTWWHHNVGGVKIQEANEYTKKEKTANQKPRKIKKNRKIKTINKKGNFVSHHARRWQQVIKIVPWLVDSGDGRAKQKYDSADVMLLGPITINHSSSSSWRLPPRLGRSAPIGWFWPFWWKGLKVTERHYAPLVISHNALLCVWGGGAGFRRCR